MACDQRTATIFLEAAEITYGAEEQSCITPDALASTSEYFSISSPVQTYHCWLDINSTGADPAPANSLPIEVDVGVGYTVSEWLTAAKAAFEAVLESGDPVFRATISSDGLSLGVEAVDIGAPLSALVDVDTGWVFEVDKAGFGENLGKTKEGIEVSYEVSSFDVFANQTGPALLLDQIIQGTGASLTAGFLELSKERLTTIIGNGYGDSFTPGGGTELIGFGTSKLFQSSFDQGGKLILHPIRLAASDRSRDVVFHKTLPLPESMNYDGTDSQALNCSFTALVDDSKRAEISVFAIGDWKQDIRA